MFVLGRKLSYLDAFEIKIARTLDSVGSWLANSCIVKRSFRYRGSITTAIIDTRVGKHHVANSWNVL